MTPEVELRERPSFATVRQLRETPRTAPCAAAREPRLLRAVERIHASVFGVATVAFDAVGVAAAATACRVGIHAAVIAVVAVVVVFTASRVYTARCSLETQGALWYAGTIVLPLSALALGFGVVTGRPRASVAFIGTIALLLIIMRCVTWTVVVTCRRARRGLRPTIVVGSGAMARTVVDKLHEYAEAGLQPVGILSPDGRRERGEGVGTGALPADLPTIITHGAIENVVLVPEGNHDDGIASCLDVCDGLDVEFALLPPLSELYLHPGLVTQVGGLPLLPLGRVARAHRAQPGKRVFDLVVASIALVIAAPVMLVTALAVWLHDRGPVLYGQRRVGRGGVPFRMLKFRSMVVGADRMVIDLTDHNVTDGLLFKMENDPRVTAVGRIIRRLSIDELPQLFNVVRGEMSLVGPRPLPVDPDDFGALDGKRHSVPPGITGYWQVSGGPDLAYQEMVKLDLSYIQNWSLWLDLRLLARTVPALLHRHGPA
jgi:exopolysaccharide biosynthesis polyprenyl glycosylphosphotransferase